MFSLLTLAKPICLLLHLMYLNLNWIDPQKSSQEKSNVPPTSRVEAQLPPQSLNIY